MTNRDEIIMRWQEAKNGLDAAKALEADLRKQVIEMNFNPDVDAEGTKNIDLGNDYKLKAVFKQTRTLDQKKISGVLDRIGAKDPEIACRLVKWKASLVKSEYDHLPPDIKRQVDNILTVKPGSPTLTLVEPKG